MPVTDQQARAIAFLAASVRPHGASRWDEGGIYANVMKVADRQLSTVVIAVMQAAEDRGALSPGVIPTTGPHWRDPGSAPKPATRPWSAAEFCHVCGQAVDAHRASDHAPESAGEYARRLAAQPIDVARAVGGLRDIKATDTTQEARPT